MQKYNPINWITKLAKRIKEDINQAENALGSAVNTIFSGIYVEECDRCGRIVQMEACRCCN